MKSLTMNLMVAAALIGVAGSASAQVMSAHIPFDFKANGLQFSPGTYRISVRGMSSGTPVVQVYNQDSKAGAVSVVSPGKDAPKSWRNRASAMLSFACAENRCELRTVWAGDDARTFELPASKNALSTLAGTINIPAIKAD